MEAVRKPLQGVKNILRFNWHYYAVALVFVFVASIFYDNADQRLQPAVLIVIILISLSVIISLAVSVYVYDFSDLYKLTWLHKDLFENGKRWANINAGFDETSMLLKNKFPACDLVVLDFYDARKHTELSIKRARKVYPPYPGTVIINTDLLPFKNNSIDNVFLILAAHEIRNEPERIIFFKEISRVLSDDGKIIVTEHVRDIVNFLAYNIGFFHFHSRKTWIHTFAESGLTIFQEIKITPFITTFILTKNGTSS